MVVAFAFALGGTGVKDASILDATSTEVEGDPRA